MGRPVSVDDATTSNISHKAGFSSAIRSWESSRRTPSRIPSSTLFSRSRSSSRFRKATERLWASCVKSRPNSAISSSPAGCAGAPRSPCTILRAARVKSRTFRAAKCAATLDINTAHSSPSSAPMDSATCSPATARSTSNSGIAKRATQRTEPGRCSGSATYIMLRRSVALSRVLVPIPS